MRNNAWIDSCPDEEFYVKSADECQACIESCKTCSNDDGCDECLDTHIKVTDENDSVSCLLGCIVKLEINILASCPEYYYKEESTPPECKQCYSTCETCVNVDEDGCTVCLAEEDFLYVDAYDDTHGSCKDTCSTNTDVIFDTTICISTGIVFSN